MTVAEALAAIPARRDALDAIDQQLSDTIRQVEAVLCDELKVRTPAEISFTTYDGAFVLSYGKWNGKWQLLIGAADGEEVTDDTPVASVSRGRRAEVFTPDKRGETPMDRLVIEVADSLVRFAQERSPQVEAAQRLLRIFAQAGFPLPPA